MNEELLVNIGLTPAQAKVYSELIKAGSLTPPQLAKRVGESRTTAYMALARLEEVGLAIKVENAKKQTYEPASPSVLDKLLAGKQAQLAETERTYREALPKLLTHYYSHRGKPGVKFYEGRDGMLQIYRDHLRSKEYVHVLRTPADSEFGETVMQYINKRAKLGVKSEMMSPEDAGAMSYAKENDKRLLRETIWFDPKLYTAPVEICIYGKKVSIISFGEEAVGVILESPQIADAMRQMYAMAKTAVIPA